MEEDIKILEEMLNSKEPVCNYILKHQEIEAISNLLTRYKQLEEENKELKAITNTYNSYEMSTPEDIRILICDSRYFCNGTFIRKYIPKSKVKEKIEEYDKREKEELKGMKGQDRYFVKQMYNYMRKPLQELLREGW